MLRLVALAVAGLLSGSAGAAPAPEPTATVLAAGDIASCRSRGDEQTARLLDRLPGTILALGDTVYEHGTDEEYVECYAPSWGRHRARTRPVVGNHEYGTAGAGGFFRYFGARAGPRRGYHAFRLGAWQIVVLNSNCRPAGGCGRGSPQERWLRGVLARSQARCTLAAMHHPRFSSGLHGSDTTLTDLWRALSAGGADVALAAHDHHYERFAPQGGVRQFVVGTGGRSHYPVVRSLRASEARNTATYGVLELRLEPDGYAWRFVGVPGSTFRDSGSARCR